MALVLYGSLPARFRIGSEWHNYMYRSIHERVLLFICPLSAFSTTCADEYILRSLLIFGHIDDETNKRICVAAGRNMISIPSAIREDLENVHIIRSYVTLVKYVICPRKTNPSKW